MPAEPPFNVPQEVPAVPREPDGDYAPDTERIKPAAGSRRPTTRRTDMTDLAPLPADPAPRVVDHLWLGDIEGHNCRVCAVRDDTLHLCWRDEHPDVLDERFAWPDDVVATMRHAMEYLTGARPDTPDWDALNERDRDQTDVLLTFLVQLVGDRIVDG